VLRVLLMAVHAPDRSPSQRFRIEGYLGWLKGRGIDTVYSWLLSGADAKTFYGKVPLAEKARVVAKALLRRAWSIAPRIFRPGYDVIFVQRESFFMGGAWFERLASLSAPLVFDFDDAIWINVVSEANKRFAYLKNTDKVSRIVRMAHTVVAGNPYLADWARQYNSNVRIVPTTIDTDVYVPRSGGAQPGAPVVIGWSGSFSTIEHFKTAVPALLRVKERFGDRVAFKVIGDGNYRHETLGVVGEPWVMATEVTELQKIDIGLMPLPDDKWARGKCGLKGLQYMALGIPTLMSPVGVNTEIVRDSENGFLPRSEDEWVERLSQLVADTGLRRRMGGMGRQTVLERYSVLRWRETYEEIIRNAAGK
jgi:glycosyltransferase involved in cell wall biosynthesis